MDTVHIHLRVRRWVIWWVCIGVIGGAIAISNILGHNLSGTQDRILIILGVAHWLLGGIVCWSFAGVEVTPAPQSPSSPVQQLPDTTLASEHHPPSDFLLPGNRRSLLPWKH
jgi:hypothetical protein